MITRATNPNYHSTQNYLGRGITVCERWESFHNFTIDMWEGYNDKLFLERIDNNKGYFPENCKWATRKEQMRNLRTNKFYEFNGKRQILGDWAEELGINRTTLWMRLHKYGMPIEKAFANQTGGASL